MAKTDIANTLVEDNLDLIRLSINTVLSKSSRRLNALEYEELEAELAKALVEVSRRWPNYCMEHGYDPQSSEWFRVFSTRRLKGAVIDYWRKESPLSRDETDYTTFARKHGAIAAAEKFGTSVADIEKVLCRRENLLNPIEVPADEPGRAHGTTWEVVTEAVAGLPEVAQVWVGLVYVDHLPSVQVREVMGLASAQQARALQGFVEYTIISAVLAGIMLR